MWKKWLRWRRRQLKVCVPKKNLQLCPRNNLQELYDQLNIQYFAGAIQAQIIWFGSATRRASSRRLLGTYNFDKRLIKIHRLLDQPHFPSYFLAYVIYHEMLHERFPPIYKRGRRRRVHHVSFQEEEKRFADYALAKAWEKENTKLFF